MRHALALHLALMRSVLRRMFASKLGGLLNILVIGIALSLPTGMYVLLKNAQSLVEQLSGAPQISLFLTLNAQEDDIAELHKRLEANESIATIEFVARDRALPVILAVTVALMSGQFALFTYLAPEIERRLAAGPP